MLDIAAAADDTERDVAAAAAAATAAAAEAVDETGGEVEPLGEDASDEGEGPFAGGNGCSSIVIEVADALFRFAPTHCTNQTGGGRDARVSSSSLARYSSPISLDSRFF